MLSKRYLLPATLGSLMLVLTFARSLTLSLGTPIARTTVGLSFMALGALALFLLYREGISFDKLLLMLLPIGAALLIRVLLLDHVTLDFLLSRTQLEIIMYHTSICLPFFLIFPFPTYMVSNSFLSCLISSWPGAGCGW